MSTGRGSGGPDSLARVLGSGSTTTARQPAVQRMHAVSHGRPAETAAGRGQRSSVRLTAYRRMTHPSTTTFRCSSSLSSASGGEASSPRLPWLLPDSEPSGIWLMPRPAPPRPPAATPWSGAAAGSGERGGVGAMAAAVGRGGEWTDSCCCSFQPPLGTAGSRIMIAAGCGRPGGNESAGGVGGGRASWAAPAAAAHQRGAGSPRCLQQLCSRLGARTRGEGVRAGVSRLHGGWEWGHRCWEAPGCPSHLPRRCRAPGKLRGTQGGPPHACRCPLLFARTGVRRAGRFTSAPRATLPGRCKRPASLAPARASLLVTWPSSSSH